MKTLICLALFLSLILTERWSIAEHNGVLELSQESGEQTKESSFTTLLNRFPGLPSNVLHRLRESEDPSAELSQILEKAGVLAEQRMDAYELLNNVLVKESSFADGDLREEVQLRLTPKEIIVQSASDPKSAFHEVAKRELNRRKYEQWRDQQSSETRRNLRTAASDLYAKLSDGNPAAKWDEIPDAEVRSIKEQISLSLPEFGALDPNSLKMGPPKKMLNGDLLFAVFPYADKPNFARYVVLDKLGFITERVGVR